MKARHPTRWYETLPTHLQWRILSLCHSNGSFSSIVGMEYIVLLIGLLIVWLGSMHILSFPLGFSLTSTYIGKPFRWLRVSLVTDQSRFSSTAAIMLHAGGVLLLNHQVTLKFLCMQQTVQVTVSLVIVRANVLEFATKSVCFAIDFSSVLTK